MNFIDESTKVSNIIAYGMENALSLNDAIDLLRENSLDSNSNITRVSNFFNQYHIEAEEKLDFVKSLAKDSKIEDLFYNNGKLMLKLKDKPELQKADRKQIEDNFLKYDIADNIRRSLLLKSNGKNKKLKLSDFHINTKEIEFRPTLDESDEDTYNYFRPGYIVEAIKREPVKELPSEFDKLLDNLANKECKEWLINHMACHLRLLKVGFRRYGQPYVLQTVPVLYGKSGTGKNLLISYFGYAISKEGDKNISIDDLSKTFNEFFNSGAININEAAKSKRERRTTKEKLKSFTDVEQVINIKFMTEKKIINSAYKTICANVSSYGILDVDEFDRRFQYIEGGMNINGKQEHLLDMKLLEEQKYDFINYLWNFKCDFDKAEQVFDTETKLKDKENSLCSADKFAIDIAEVIDQYKGEYFNAKSIQEWYNAKFGGTELYLDRSARQIFMKRLLKELEDKAVKVERIQLGKAEEYVYEGRKWDFSRKEYVYKLV